MRIDPSTLTVTELITGLRAAAAGHYPREAAVELLIRHWTWLSQPLFTRRCVRAPDGNPEALAIDWPQMAQLARGDGVEPADRAIALLAVQLGGFPDSVDVQIDLANIPPLAWLVASLRRHEIDLVLGAISHASGTHDHVEHVGEPVSGNPAGEWRVTRTSPRLHLGPSYPWPEPALPGLTDDAPTDEL